MSLLNSYIADDLGDIYRDAEIRGRVLRNFPLQQSDAKFRELVRRTGLNVYDAAQMGMAAANQYPDMKNDGAGVQAFFQKEHSRPALIDMGKNKQSMNLIFPVHATGQFLACELPTGTAKVMLEDEIAMNQCDYERLGRNDLFVPGGWRWRMTMDLRDANIDLRNTFEKCTGHHVKDDLRDRSHKLYATETNVGIGKTKACPEVMIAFYNNAETRLFLDDVPPVEEKTIRKLATQAYRRTSYERLMNN